LCTNCIWLKYLLINERRPWKLAQTADEETLAETVWSWHFYQQWEWNHWR
jgi:hypothetical protein